MIMMCGIDAGYEGKSVFHGLSLNFPETGTAAIMGESGCGKTTLLKVLAGLLKPTKGCIVGLENKKVSMVFQEDRLLPNFTLFDNITAVSSEQEARFWLCEMELGDHLYEFPAELSGGMQRRAALARALSFKGDLLLMDEPFKGLDDALKARIIGRIQKAAPLIVMATHNEAEARAMNADAIYSLNSLPIF